MCGTTVLTPLAHSRGFPRVSSVSTRTLAVPPATLVTVEIGGTAIELRTRNADFGQLLAERYRGFVGTRRADHDLEIQLIEPADDRNLDRDLEVTLIGEEWLLERGDFRASWKPRLRRGTVRQPASPYAIDSVLRIIHSLILAERGGFLLHAASAVRYGRAFLFAGVSGAGKTTISRLAPPDANLLSDEISYVIKDEGTYLACGTPFAGELARAGENISAPIGGLYLLEKGRDNRIENLGKTEVIPALLRNVLFFAHDRALVSCVFDAICEFASQVPVQRLIFAPNERVWDIIR